jgi:hypothetical protein
VSVPKRDRFIRWREVVLDRSAGVCGAYVIYALLERDGVPVQKYSEYLHFNTLAIFKFSPGIHMIM